MSAACWECAEREGRHEHHVIPKSQGGRRTVLLCERCHGVVHGRDMSTSGLTRAALAAKKARGERTGALPFGSRLAADGLHMEDDPHEQRVISTVLELRAAGYTIRAIADRLNAIPSMAPRRGKSWHFTQVGRILGRSGAAIPEELEPSPPRATRQQKLRELLGLPA